MLAKRNRRRIWLSAVACALSLVALGTSVLAGPSADKKMQLGELLFFNGNIDGAINAFRAAAAINPKLWQAHLNLANMYIQKGQDHFPQAIEELREVLKIKPNNKDVHLILGNLLRAQNDLDGAERHLRKAIELGAAPAMAHNALAITMLQKGKIDEAHEHISRAIEKQKKFPDAHLTRGVLLFKKGEKEEALKAFDMAVAQKGKYPEAHNAKGDILGADGKWKEALEEYAKATEEEPKYAQAWANVGNAQFQLGNIKEARQAYAKAKELNASDKNILYGLAIMLEKSGNTDEAIAEFQNALMLETDQTMATQIRLHIDQLRGRGSFQIGGIGGVIPGMQVTNPFGANFADLIKLKPPKSAAKK